MREAMRQARVGDDGYGDDPTLNRLQQLAATLLGKEDALFVPSGTMGNLVSIMVHTSPGDELICERDAHVLNSEMGGVAAVAGCVIRAVAGVRGVMDPGEVDRLCRKPGARPRTGVICVENTHNAAGGVVTPLDNLRQLKQIAQAKQVAVHMDGARIFNAAACLGVEPKCVAQHADSVMFCLSKALGAPMGSVIVGTKQFIHEARYVRKMLGGTLRQAGVVAAAGIVALETMVGRLAEDHENARLLATGLRDIGLDVDTSLVDTNLVYVVPPAGMSAEQLAKVCVEMGVLAKPSMNRVRLVTHYQVTADDVKEALGRFAHAVTCGAIRLG